MNEGAESVHWTDGLRLLGGTHRSFNSNTFFFLEKSQETLKNVAPSLHKSLLYETKIDVWEASGSRAASVFIFDISRNCNSVDGNQYRHDEASDVIVIRF